jgi:broad specificity phosphatase PhoE
MNHACCRSTLRGVALALALSLPAPAFAQKAIIVVRHAEKVDESADPLLSAAGEARAAALARILRSLEVKAAYVTQYRRTTLTAEPLMAAMNLKPITIPATDTPVLVERMRKEHPNDVVLTVGHSNTLPLILNLLGSAEAVEIGPDEYDSLFVVVPQASDPPTVLHLRF